MVEGSLNGESCRNNDLLNWPWWFCAVPTRCSYLKAIVVYHCRSRCSSVRSGVEFLCRIKEPSGKILTFITPVAGYPLRGFYATCQ